ncbi:MAG: STAS domain-containing protein [Magnetococcales bacterium]|nr:STAS domain-containing protein [Magnetococcales bacterium]
MITVEEHGQRVTLRLPKQFNFKIQREFQECYRQRPPGRAYEIDFRPVSDMDSSALGMLLLLRSHCGGDKADIRLIHCSPGIKSLLESVKFDALFSIE